MKFSKLSYFVELLKFHILFERRLVNALGMNTRGNVTEDAENIFFSEFFFFEGIHFILYIPLS